MRRVIVVSGAGLSAESGIPTFRDPGGMWEQFDPKLLADMASYATNRQQVEAFYSLRRQELAQFSPNAAHHMLAQIQLEYTPERVLLYTQNGDDLLERAGAPNVCHLHGKLTDYACLVCGLVWPVGYVKADQLHCPRCQSAQTKPGVIFFGEAAPLYAELDKTIKESTGDLILVIGTQGAVLPFKRLVGNRHHPRRAQTWLINKHREHGINYRKFFDLTLFSSVCAVVPGIERRLRDFLSVAA